MPYRIIVLFTLFCGFFSCTDAVEPVFDFTDGFLLIEGRVVDEPGYSSVSIARNQILFDNYVLTPIDGATVSVVDGDGVEVFFPVQGTQQEPVYVAPDDFAAQRGQTYFVRAVLPSGEIVESTPEPVPTNVGIDNLRVRFQQEAYFSESRDRFIPAFDMLVDVNDPAEEDNYYEYTYTAFEGLDVCASCVRARWRDGVCIAGPDTRFVTRWDYLCSTPCWISTKARGRQVSSDAFGNGLRITDILAGRHDWTRPGGLLLAVDQFTTSRASFEYNSVIDQLANGGGGLNAPLPAALVGNLKDVSDNNTSVLGFIGVSSLSQERIYFDRDTIDGESLPYDGAPRLEPVIPAPPTAPCTGGTRTTVKPEGWEG